MDNQNQEEQLGTLQLLVAMEKERVYENRYLELYKNLIRSRLDVLRYDPSKYPVSNDYTEESLIVRKAMTAERNAWMTGLLIASVVFISVRKLPYWVTKLIGGETKLQAMYDAEIAASKRPNAHLKRMGGMLNS